MRANCKQCHASIHLLSMPEHAVGSCSSCGEPYFVEADAKGLPLRLIFEGDARQNTQRTCSRCGNKFQADSNEALPVCSQCKTGEHRIGIDETGWMLRKMDGRLFGPTTKSELLSLAAKGVFSKGDQIKAPETAWTPVQFHADFKKYFPDTPGSKGMVAIPWKQKITLWLHRSGRLLFLLTLFLIVLMVALQLWQRYQRGEITLMPAVEQAIDPYTPLLALLAQEVALNPQTQDDIATWLTRAENALSRDDYSQARLVVVGIKQWLLRQPQNPLLLGLLSEMTVLVARHLLADPAHALELQQRALLLADKAILLDRRQPYGWRGKLAALMQANNPTAVIQEYDNALLADAALDRDAYLKLYFMMAKAKIDTNPVQMQMELLQLQKQFPQLQNVHNVLAQVYAQQGDYYHAIRQLQKRLTLVSTHLPSLAQLSQLYQQIGDAKSAALNYEKWLRLQPEANSARIALAVVRYQQMQNKPEAKRLFMLLLNRYQISESERAQVTFHMCNLEATPAAIQWCDESLKLQPYEQPAKLLRAYLLDEQGKHDLAQSEWESAYSLQPHDMRVASARIINLLKQQHHAEAQQLGAELTSVNTGYPLLWLSYATSHLVASQPEVAENILSGGLVQLDWNDWQQMQADFSNVEYGLWRYCAIQLQQAVTSGYNTAGILTALAMATLRTEPKRTENAIHWLQQALSKNTNARSAALLLAELYLQQRQQWLSIPIMLQPFLDDSKSGEHARMLIGESYLRRGKLQKAKDYLSTQTQQPSSRSCRLAVDQVSLYHLLNIKDEKYGAYKQMVWQCALPPLASSLAIELVMQGKLGAVGEP